MKRYELECGVALSNGFSNPQTKKLQTISKRYSVGAVWVYETEPCWIAAASLDWFCAYETGPCWVAIASLDWFCSPG